MTKHFLDLYLEYYSGVAVPEQFKLWSAIAGVAALLERKCWWDKGSDHLIFPNMYITLVGWPAAGKTTAIRNVKNLIHKFNTKMQELQQTRGVIFAPNQITPAAFIKDGFQRAARSRPLPSLGFVTDSPVFCISDEFGNFVKDNGGGSIASDLLEYYDCPTGPYEKITISRGCEIIKSPCLSMLSGTTPTFLRDYLSSESSRDGFASRTLFVVETELMPRVAKFGTGNPLLRETLDLEVERLFRLLGEFTEDKEAEQYYLAWLQGEHEVERQKYKGDSIIANFYSRKDTQVEKLRIIMSACRNNSRIIIKEDIQRSISILRNLEVNIGQCIGVRDISRDSNLSDKIVQQIPKWPEKITYGEIFARLYKSGYHMAAGFHTNNVLESLILSEKIAATTEEHIQDKCFYRKT